MSDVSAHTSPGTASIEDQLEQLRVELTGYCYRMLGSSDAEDAVQESFVRAWRGHERFEGRGSLRSWVYRIATNVCMDMLVSRKRRALPMDLGPAGIPDAARLHTRERALWVEPMPDARLVPDGDPADVAIARESIRLAFVAALQTLPPRQRAVLILCEVFRWTAADAAELLESSVPAVNSALQRARAALRTARPDAETTPRRVEPADEELLDRYVDAFEHYDMEALTELIHDDATQSMPPYDLWLQGRRDMFAWWVGPGNGCRGSRVVRATSANGSPAFGQYKPNETGGYEPWALQVLDVIDGKIGSIVFFLDAQVLFPIFGLPLVVAGGAGPMRSAVRSGHRHIGRFAHPKETVA